MSEETPQVVLTDADPAGAEKARLKAEHQSQQASVRAGHVTGLRNELAYLERQPTVNAGRVAAVKAELDRYAEKPSQRRQEAAVPKDPAAKKAAAKKAPAKRAPAKKK